MAKKRTTNKKTAASKRKKPANANAPRQRDFTTPRQVILLTDFPKEESERLATAMNRALNPALHGMPDFADLLFRSAAFFSMDYRGLITDVESPLLGDITSALVGNFDRVRALVGLPQYAGAAATLFQYRFTKAVHAVTGRLNWS